MNIAFRIDMLTD